MNRSKIIFCLLFYFSLTVRGEVRKLICVHTVMDLAPFCTVTLKELEDGTLESPVLIEHQGQPQHSMIREVKVESGEMYHLFLDADKPGQEIEMIVENINNENGEYPAVLINHEVPFAQEMKGTCKMESRIGTKALLPINTR